MTQQCGSCCAKVLAPYLYVDQLGKRPLTELGSTHCVLVSLLACGTSTSGVAVGRSHTSGPGRALVTLYLQTPATRLWHSDPMVFIFLPVLLSSFLCSVVLDLFYRLFSKYFTQ